MTTKRLTRRAPKDYVFKALIADIHKGIASRELPPGHWLPGENQLAEQYQISRISVRRALKLLNKEGVTEPVPGKGTRIVATDTTTLSGLVIVLPYEVVNSHSYYGKIVAGLTAKGEGLGMHCRFIGYGRMHSSRFNVLKEIPLKTTTGIVFLAETNSLMIPPLSEIPGPAIQADHRLPQLACDSVELDFRQVGRLAVEHLAKKGRRRIAYIGWAKEKQLDPLRYSCIEATCATQGLTLTPNLTRWVGSSVIDGNAAMSDLLAAGIPFDAVICYGPSMASGAILACRHAHKTIPDDISIVALGDSYGYEDGHLDMTLTRIVPDLDAFCEAVIARLLVRFKNRTEPPQALFTPVSLVAGETT